MKKARRSNINEGYALAGWISALFVLVAGIFLFI